MAVRQMPLLPAESGIDKLAADGLVQPAAELSQQWYGSVVRPACAAAIDILSITGQQQTVRKDSDQPTTGAAATDNTPAAVSVAWHAPDGSDAIRVSPAAADSSLDIGKVALTWCPDLITSMRKFYASVTKALPKPLTQAPMGKSAPLSANTEPTDPHSVSTNAHNANSGNPVSEQQPDKLAGPGYAKPFIQQVTQRLIDLLAQHEVSANVAHVQLAGTSAATSLLRRAVIVCFVNLQLTNKQAFLGTELDPPATSNGKKGDPMPVTDGLGMSGSLQAGTASLAAAACGTMHIDPASFAPFGPAWQLLLETPLLGLAGSRLQNISLHAAESAAAHADLKPHQILQALLPRLQLGALAWCASANQLQTIEHVLASLGACNEKQASGKGIGGTSIQTLASLQLVEIMAEPMTASWEETASEPRPASASDEGAGRSCAAPCLLKLWCFGTFIS